MPRLQPPLDLASPAMTTNVRVASQLMLVVSALPLMTVSLPLPGRPSAAAPPRALLLPILRATPTSAEQCLRLNFSPTSTPQNTPAPLGPSEYELNLGRVIDTLRFDYPCLLTREPDFSIFVDGIELHDPSGMRLRGIHQYRRFFHALRFLRKTTLCDCEITFRLAVTNAAVRVRWSSKLWMRDPALGLLSGSPMHLDGVSVYELDDVGLVIRHRLEITAASGSEHQGVIDLAFVWPVCGMVMPEMVIPLVESASPQDASWRRYGCNS